VYIIFVHTFFSEKQLSEFRRLSLRRFFGGMFLGPTNPRNIGTYYHLNPIIHKKVQRIPHKQIHCH